MHLIFDGSKRTMDESIFTMLSAWAEQSEKLRCGKISKEQYDHWRYTFPEEDTTQRWAKVPSQGLSDLLVEAFKDQQKENEHRKARTDIQSVRASIIWRSL